MKSLSRNENVDYYEPALATKENRNGGAAYTLNDELKAFLNLRRMPARLNAAQTAACLGIKPHDIPILVAKKFLKPLGQPAPNTEKYFSRRRVLDCAEDETWLSQVTKALSEYWKSKNDRRSKDNA